MFSMREAHSEEKGELEVPPAEFANRSLNHEGEQAKMDQASRAV